MEEITVRKIHAYLKRIPLQTLNTFENMIAKEKARRNELKQLDLVKLKTFLKAKYPFIYQRGRTNNKVAYRIAIASILEQFSREYSNLQKGNISNLIDIDRSTIYHYVSISDRMNLPGYEFNAIAYEDVKKELIHLIKSKQFDK